VSIHSPLFSVYPLLYAVSLPRTCFFPPPLRRLNSFVESASCSTHGIFTIKDGSCWPPSWTTSFSLQTALFFWIRLLDITILSLPSSPHNPPDWLLKPRPEAAGMSKGLPGGFFGPAPRGAFCGHSPYSFAGNFRVLILALSPPRFLPLNPSFDLVVAAVVTYSILRISLTSPPTVRGFAPLEYLRAR